jgi:hypothetical protein
MAMPGSLYLQPEIAKKIDKLVIFEEKRFVKESFYFSDSEKGKQKRLIIRKFRFRK